MPMPKPRKGENQKDFHTRCMGDSAMIGEYPEDTQRNAVCYAQWEVRDMPEFKGFEEWVEIFRGGKQVDSQGVERDGDWLIERAVSTFNAAEHEPPAVIGHPRDNAPAYGWVENLKTDAKNGAKVLLARFKQVVPEFGEMVKNGLFKKRSAAFYPDGRLRHVGFLGSAPPAVKGLADMAFDEAEGFISFSDTRPWTWHTIAGVLRKLREYFIEKEGAERADALIPEWDIEAVREEADKGEEPGEPEASGIFNQPQKGGSTMTFKDFLEAFKFWKEAEKDPEFKLPETPAQGGGEGKTFSEADLDAAAKAAEEKARKEAEAQFSEKSRRDARKTEIRTFIDQGVKDGKILPAWKDAGIAAFMEGLDDAGAVEFAEGKDKQSPYEWFKTFMEGLGRPDIFKIIASNENRGGEFSEAAKDVELGKSIAAKVSK